jgi:hypothetical protein
MTKHLLLGVEHRHSDWRLPDNCDIEALWTAIEHAMATGEAVRIQVEAPEAPARHADLVLNGRVLPFIAVVDVPEPAGFRRY